MKWLGTAALALASFCLGMAGSDAAESAKIHVLTSIPPIFCFAANVAGDAADVQNLIPGHVGPHDYQFTSKDIKKVAEADLIFVNGLGLESWLDKAITVNGAKLSSKRIEVAGDLGPKLMRSAENGGHEETALVLVNPHVWLDPQLAAHCVTNILLALQKADPGKGDIYAKNAAAYIARLQDLDAELAKTLEPVRSRPFITYHDAFPYFVRRYGLQLAGVVEETPDVEPSPRYLAKLAQTIREKGVKVIFTEPQFSSKLVQQITRDLHISAGQLDPLETAALTRTSYEEGMRNNARSLREALSK